MGLAALVGGERRPGHEPLGALDAVVLAQGRQVLDQLGVLVLLEVLGRPDVGLDLVEVPELYGVSEPGHGHALGWGGGEQGTNLLYRRVLVSVRLFSTPML